MKHELVSLMYGAGLFAPFRKANRDKALILMYHRFRAESDGAPRPHTELITVQRIELSV